MHKIIPPFLAVLAVTLTGCFSYVPTDLAAVAPGEPVKVEISRVALSNLLLADSLSAQVGPLVRGTLARRDPAEILIRVPSEPAFDGPGRVAFARDVRIPTGGVLEIGTRRVNWLTTGLAIGAGAGVAAFITHYVMSGAQASSLAAVPEPDNVRIPAPSR